MSRGSLAVLARTEARPGELTSRPSDRPPSGGPLRVAACLPSDAREQVCVGRRVKTNFTAEGAQTVWAGMTCFLQTLPLLLEGLAVIAQRVTRSGPGVVIALRPVRATRTEVPCVIPSSSPLPVVRARHDSPFLMWSRVPHVSRMSRRDRAVRGCRVGVPGETRLAGTEGRRRARRRRYLFSPAGEVGREPNGTAETWTK
jgi:hypothetical protein